MLLGNGQSRSKVRLHRMYSLILIYTFCKSTLTWFGCIVVKGHIMAAGDARVFPGFLTPVLTSFSESPKSQTTFLTWYRGTRQKYARKKVQLNLVSNSQPPGLESDMLTTEPPRWD